MIPALIRKFHEAKSNGCPTVTVWGSGTPRREFLYSDDMADACVFLMNLSVEKFNAVLNAESSAPPLINIGSGEDITIKELAELIKSTIGYTGELVFDTTKPDGTMRKLMDTSRMTLLGWRPITSLTKGLDYAYRDCMHSINQIVL